MGEAAESGDPASLTFAGRRGAGLGLGLDLDLDLAGHISHSGHEAARRFTITPEWCPRPERRFCATVDGPPHTSAGRHDDSHRGGHAL